jgi:hypothetical protein
MFDLDVIQGQSSKSKYWPPAYQTSHWLNNPLLLLVWNRFYGNKASKKSFVDVIQDVSDGVSCKPRISDMIIFTIFSGFTGLITVPCSLRKCRFSSKCVFTGRSLECRCPVESDCSERAGPVCGFDGKTKKTYKSQCLMEVEGCSKSKNIKLVSFGPCGEYSRPWSLSDISKNLLVIYCKSCILIGYRTHYLSADR